MTSGTFFLFVLVSVPVACGGRTGLDLGGAGAGDSSGRVDSGADVACTEVCSGTCSVGSCVVTLASGQGAGGGSIAVADTSVYWSVASAFPGVALASVPKAGGTVSTLVASSSSEAAYAVAADGAAVYWVGTKLAVLRVPASGGAITTLATSPHRGAADTIAVQGGDVYWSTLIGTDGEIMSVPVGGGAPTTVVASKNTFAVDASGIYFDADGFDGIERLPLGGGPATTVVSPAMEGFGHMYNAIGVDSTSVYWTTERSALLTVPKGGGLATTLIPATTTGPLLSMMVVGSSDVYCVTQDLDTNVASIVQVPKNGGPLTTVVPDVQPSALATDATSLYWTTQNTVMKLTPTCACE